MAIWVSEWNEVEASSKSNIKLNEVAWMGVYLKDLGWVPGRFILPFFQGLSRTLSLLAVSTWKWSSSILNGAEGLDCQFLDRLLSLASNSSTLELPPAFQDIQLTSVDELSQAYLELWYGWIASKL